MAAESTATPPPDLPSVVIAASTTASRLCRIAVLHGWCQNASVLRDKLHGFVRKLCGADCGADIIFLEAPHVIPAGDAGERVNARGWWTYSASDRSDVTDFETRRTYYGWDESRRVITSAAATHGPFDVLVGFSQGAVAVHLLTCELEAYARHGVTSALPEGCRGMKPPRAVICVAGFPAACALPLSEGQLLETPSLHVSSEADIRVPAEMQRSLAARFKAPEMLMHDKGHSVPQRAADMAAMIEFIRRHVHGAVDR